MAKNEITYYWGDRSLLIKLGNRTNARIRALFIAEFILTSFIATVLLIKSLPFRHVFIDWAAGVGGMCLYLFAAFRFLSRIFFSERLLIDTQSLTIIRKWALAQQVRRYNLREIGALHYEGKRMKTDHPLKGKCYDYLGFETQEHLIQSLHDEGNLYFETYEGRVYFAAGVYSWDAEEMVQIMQLYIGSALQLGPEWKEMANP